MSARRRAGARLAAALVLVLAGATAGGVADAVTLPSAGSATTAATAASQSGLPVADVPQPGAYRALSAARVLDTRTTGVPLARGGRLVIPVLGRLGVPPTGVGAVQLHVTAVGASATSHLTVHPSGVAPTTSSLNYEAGRAVGNTVTARPGADGAVVVTNGAATVHLVVDLVGWAAATPSTDDPGLHAIAPRRVWDSRTAGRPLDVRGTTVVVVGGTVPATARAVIANLTTVGASASGLPLLSWPAGAPRPSTSNGNTVRGVPVATQVVVGIGTGGRVALATGSGTTHLVLDVVGYLAGPRSQATAADGQLRSVAPLRLVDTRTTGVPLASGQRLVQQVTGRAGVPRDASAALVTITSVPGTKNTGTLVVVGNGEGRPPTSDLNARVDVPVARQVITRLGIDGGIAVVRTGGTGHVIVDLVGYVSSVPAPVAVGPTTGLLGGGDPAGELGPQAAAVLRGSVRYALGPWWRTVAPVLLARPLDAAAQSDSTDAVRRLSMEAFAVSTAVATGTYSPGETGMSEAQALDVVGTVVGSVACRHRANVIGGWGQTWQSTLWSSLAARAAWLSWAAMPEQTRACVQAMVVSEADYATRLKPETRVSATGVVLRAGDSASEENSWYALAPAVAVAMMPAAERRDVWRAAQVRLLAASWTRRADLVQNPVVDGQRLTTLVSGANVEADGTVINHDRIAPDYSTNVYQNVDGILLATLAGQRAPEASLLGLPAVYAALGTNTYKAGLSYLAPGGTVYDPLSPFQPARFGVYYPQGCDWGLAQVLPYALTDAQAAAYGFGGPAGTPTDAAASAARHLAEATTMQQRYSDGRMFAGSSEYTYVGREEHTAQLAAQLVLTLALATPGQTAAAVAPAGVAVTPLRQLQAPPAPSDESRLMQAR
jgi:hypothetical protein